MRSLFWPAIGTFLLPLLLAAQVDAATDSFSPAEVLGSLKVNLDTKDGHASLWTIDDVGNLNALRTTVTFLRLGRDRKWAPASKIYLGNGDNYIELTMAAENFRSPLSIKFSQFLEKEKVSEARFSTVLDTDQKLDVAINWKQDGEVSIFIGTEVARKSIGMPIKFVSFMTSTAETAFDPLRFGYFTE